MMARSLVVMALRLSKELKLLQMTSLNSQTVAKLTHMRSKKTTMLFNVVFIIRSMEQARAEIRMRAAARW